jgi:trk system potassium uptake protein TrkH
MFYYPKKLKETQIITRDVSIIAFWFGLLFLIPMLVGVVYGEPTWSVYLPMILITTGLAYFFLKFFKKKEEPFTRMTLITIAVTWIMVCIVGSFPFFFATDMGPLDSLFESVSSVSTAGLTNIELPESVPKSVMFWRAMLAWFGGIGITAVAFYSIMQNDSVSKIVLGEGFERLKPSLVNSAKEIFKIYSFWSIAGILVLILIGTPVFDSFSISLNAISTTGVDVRNDGWLYYQQTMPETFPIMAVVVGLLMVMGAVSFVAHYRVLKNRRLRMFWQDSETKAYIIILLIGVGLVFSYMMLTSPQGAIPLSYEALSTSTTGGFELSPYISGTEQAGNFIMGILIVMALIGGSSNSAAGGLKVKRVLILFKYVFWKVSQQLAPKGTISHFRHAGKRITAEEVANIAVYGFIYCAAIILITMVMVSFGYGAVDSALVVTSAQAGGGVTPIPGWELVAPVKLALIGTMLFGRLEFIPLFTLILYILRRH